MMKVLLGIAGAVLIGAVGTGIYIFTGNMNIAATAKDPALVHWVLENTRVNTVRNQSDDIVVPDLQSEGRIAIGGKAYDGMCVSCHSAPGKDALLGAIDMNPPPPELTDISSKRSPEEIFWVIKNGIRMTGMPAWGNTHNDKQIWDMVAFIQTMPELTSAKYASLISSVKDDGHDHEHGPSASDHHSPGTSQTSHMTAPEGVNEHASLSNADDHHGNEKPGASHHDDKVPDEASPKKSTVKKKTNSHDGHDHAH